MEIRTDMLTGFATIMLTMVCIHFIVFMVRRKPNPDAPDAAPRRSVHQLFGIAYVVAVAVFVIALVWTGGKPEPTVNERIGTLTETVGTLEPVKSTNSPEANQERLQKQAAEGQADSMKSFESFREQIHDQGPTANDNR